MLLDKCTILVYNEIKERKNGVTVMSEFNNGAKHARDDILATIIGLQNEIGGDENYPVYAAYQKLYNLIVEKQGDMFTEFQG